MSCVCASLTLLRHGALDAIYRVVLASVKGLGPSFVRLFMVTFGVAWSDINLGVLGCQRCPVKAIIAGHILRKWTTQCHIAQQQLLQQHLISQPANPDPQNSSPALHCASIARQIRVYFRCLDLQIVVYKPNVILLGRVAVCTAIAACSHRPFPLTIC